MCAVSTARGCFAKGEKIWVSPNDLRSMKLSTRRPAPPVAPPTPTFRVGDRVEVIDAAGAPGVATVGDLATVTSVPSPSYPGETEMVYVTTDSGKRYSMYFHRFARTNKPKPLPHTIPGTFLKNLRSGNVVQVKPSGALTHVHVEDPGAGYQNYIGSYYLPSQFSPPLSEWTVVKPAVKTVTEYVPA